MPKYSTAATGRVFEFSVANRYILHMLFHLCSCVEIPTTTTQLQQSMPFTGEYSVIQHTELNVQYLGRKAVTSGVVQQETEQKRDRSEVVQQEAELKIEFSVLDQQMPKLEIDTSAELETDLNELVQQEAVMGSELVQQATKLEIDLSGIDKRRPEQFIDPSGVVQQENTELSREHQESTFSAEPSTPPPPVPSHSPIKTAVKVRVEVR